MKKISYFFSAVLCLFLVVACQPSNPSESVAAPTEEDTKTLRTPAKHINSKAYNYKTLAAFENGKISTDFKAAMDFADKEINFMVLYESEAPWADSFDVGQYAATGDETFNALIETYQLKIIDQFEIDDLHEGLILEALSKIENPIEAAREISLVDHVAMVQLKEVPKAEAVNASFAND